MNLNYIYFMLSGIHEIENVHGIEINILVQFFNTKLIFVLTKIKLLLIEAKMCIR